MITEQDIDDLKSRTKWKYSLEELAAACDWLTTPGNIAPRVEPLPLASSRGYGVTADTKGKVA